MREDDLARRFVALSDSNQNFYFRRILENHHSDFKVVSRWKPPTPYGILELTWGVKIEGKGLVKNIVGYYYLHYVFNNATNNLGKFLYHFADSLLIEALYLNECVRIQTYKMVSIDSRECNCEYCNDPGGLFKKMKVDFDNYVKELKSLSTDHQLLVTVKCFQKEGWVAIPQDSTVAQGVRDWLGFVEEKRFPVKSFFSTLVWIVLVFFLLMFLLLCLYVWWWMNNMSCLCLIFVFFIIWANG